MDFLFLHDVYRLSPPHSITPAQAGTASQVWNVETTDGTFLLRALPTRQQGEKEWLICQHLLRKGFGQIPTLFPTVSGSPVWEQNGVFYQLQQFVHGSMPHPTQSGTPRAIAQTASSLVTALCDCPVWETNEPSLLRLWSEGRAHWSLLNTPYSIEEAEAQMIRCSALPQRDLQMIHGDLGPWNLLASHDGSLTVIDFGAARMGDPFFDLATALGGLINHTPPEERAAVCREFLSVAPGDRSRLLEQLRLWVWRSLAQWAVFAGRGIPAVSMAARFCNALNWAEENLYEL